jgi:hypothetical protein
MSSQKNIRCERCGKTLDPKKAKMLELSITDGNYYAEIPEGHESQGGFYFGTDCVAIQLKATREYYTNLKNISL